MCIKTEAEVESIPLRMPGEGRHPLTWDYKYFISIFHPEAYQLMTAHPVYLLTDKESTIIDPKSSCE